VPGSRLLLPLAGLFVACFPRVSRTEMDHAEQVLGCGSVYPARPVKNDNSERFGDPESINKQVYEIQGCGKAMYFRSVCDARKRCKLKGDDILILEHAAKVLPCASPQLAIQHAGGSNFRVSGCGQVLDYTADRAGFAARVAQVPAASAAAASSATLGQQITKSRGPLAPSDIFARSYQSIMTVIAGDNQGTGFSISTNGLIVTNLHVIVGAAEIRVRFVDGAEGRALHVEAYDVKHDLALLRINRNLQALPLGDRDQFAIGERIVTIGNPLGLQATISEGIVSGVRSTEEGLEYVQTTAPISPGSSGGPIINQFGEVIGVSTFILRGGNNLGFGLPSKYIQDLVGRRRHIALPQFARETAEAPSEGIAGCSSDDRLSLKTRLTSALEAGAELEKSGRWLALRQLYEGAIVDVVSSVAESCKGPRRNLSDARDGAASLASDKERATALRSALEKVRSLAGD
jgi:serine protease Do